MMRWKKDKFFIEVESANSTDKNDEVLIVNTNVPWDELPLEFKEQVPVSDLNKCNDLMKLVEIWAKENSFSQAEKDGFL